MRQKLALAGGKLLIKVLRDILHGNVRIFNSGLWCR